MSVVALSACLSVQHMLVQCPCSLEEGLESPWDWSCRQLLAAMWVLGTEPWSSARATSACNHSASLQPLCAMTLLRHPHCILKEICNDLVFLFWDRISYIPSWLVPQACSLLEDDIEPLMSPSVRPGYRDYRHAHLHPVHACWHGIQGFCSGFVLIWR